MSLPAQWREHAQFCGTHGSPLYAELLTALADDLDAGGVTAEIVDGHPATRVHDVVQLRLLGALHRLVLQGRAPRLAPWYPSVGGRNAPAGVWPAAREVLGEHRDEVRAALDLPPQTNEPGRSAALAVGLTVAAARSGLRRVRLLELGASAGLNLLVDRYRVSGAGWRWGPTASPVGLDGAVRGGWPQGVDPGAPAPEVVARRGCDLDPVPHTDEGRQRLLSFVWPDQVARFRRLQQALQVARTDPPVVDRAPMVPWLTDQLGCRPGDPDPDPDVLTVVWHSVTMQYVPLDERSIVDAVVERARRRGPVVRLSMEVPDVAWSTAPLLALDGEVLARVAPHGVPVELGADVDGPVPAGPWAGTGLSRP